jgi:hypothetical protein
MRLTPEEITELNRYMFHALKQKRFDVKLSSKGYLKSVSKFGVECLPGICQSYVDGKQEYSYICLDAGRVDPSDLGFYCKENPKCALNSYTKERPVKVDIRNYTTVIDKFIMHLNNDYMTVVRSNLKNEGLLPKVKIKGTGDVFDGKYGRLEEESEDKVTVLVNFDDKGRKVRQFFKKDNIEIIEAEALLEENEENKVNLEVFSQTFVYPRDLHKIDVGHEEEEPQDYRGDDYVQDPQDIKNEFTDIIVSGNTKEIKYPETLSDFQIATKVIFNRPHKLTKIGILSFSGCLSLETIVIPDSVRSIDHRAFSGCSSLKTITISSRLLHLGKNVFEGCTSLKSIKWQNKEYSSYKSFITSFNKQNFFPLLREDVNDNEDNLEVINIKDEKINLLAEHENIELYSILSHKDYYNMENVSDTVLSNTYVVLDEEGDVDREYLVCNEAQAKEYARRRLEDELDDYDNISNVNGYMDFIDVEWFDDYLYEREQDYFYNMDEDELMEEAVNSEVLGGDDFEKDEDGNPDYTKPKKHVDIDDVVEKLTTKSVDNYSDGVEWYKDNFGEKALVEIVIEERLIDIDGLIDYILRNDGYGPTLSHYDGNEIYLGKDSNGQDLYAYRTN